MSGEGCMISHTSGNFATPENVTIIGCDCDNGDEDSKGLSAISVTFGKEESVFVMCNVSFTWLRPERESMIGVIANNVNSSKIENLKMICQNINRMCVIASLGYTSVVGSEFEGKGNERGLMIEGACDVTNCLFKTIQTALELEPDPIGATTDAIVVNCTFRDVRGGITSGISGMAEVISCHFKGAHDDAWVYSWDSGEVRVENCCFQTIAQGDTADITSDSNARILIGPGNRFSQSKSSAIGSGTIVLEEGVTEADAFECSDCGDLGLGAESFSAAEQWSRTQSFCERNQLSSTDSSPLMESCTRVYVAYGVTDATRVGCVYADYTQIYTDTNRIVYFRGGSLSLLRVVFRDSGLMSLIGSLVFVENCDGDVSFEDVRCERIQGSWGAIQIKKSDPSTTLVNITNCQFLKGEFSYAGWIYVIQSSTIDLRISGLLMKDSVSNNNGMIGYNIRTWQIEDAVFENVTSAYPSVLVYMQTFKGEVMVLNRCTFMNEPSSGLDELIMFRGKEFTLKDSTLLWDASTGWCGLEFYDANIVRILNSTIGLGGENLFRTIFVRESNKAVVVENSRIEAMPTTGSSQRSFCIGNGVSVNSYGTSFVGGRTTSTYFMAGDAADYSFFVCHFVNLSSYVVQMDGVYSFDRCLFYDDVNWSPTVTSFLGNGVLSLRCCCFWSDTRTDVFATEINVDSESTYEKALADTTKTGTAQEFCDPVFESCPEFPRCSRQWIENYFSTVNVTIED
jgi:hypothetical protein